MELQRFAIVDIETTGGLSKRDKITEIAIIVYQNGEVINSFESLINPERSIPYEITRMTGISSEMVENAPKFYEIAKDILQITDNSIFVAHNVFFDYNFIREEFHQLGYSFSRKKLCTVQLSRRYFPGLKSYSLGSLIEYFKIEVNARHRAMEDTKATLDIFNRIMELQNENNISTYLKESKIPAHIKSADIQSLPERPGVYCMRDKFGTPIYIGKSKNIRDRILQHFNDMTLKTRKMLEMVHSIDAVESGNELMASLIEASEIKQLQPEINRALRKKTHSILLTSKKSHDGYHRFMIKESEWLDSSDEIINHYATRPAAKEFLDYLLNNYNLCKKINDANLDEQSCYSYQIGKCSGACIGKENKESYNERYELAYHEVNKVFKESFMITAIGRKHDENSIILVENGFCSFIGFISNSEAVLNLVELKNNLNPYSGNVETNRMIELHLSRSKEYKKSLLKNFVQTEEIITDTLP